MASDSYTNIHDITAELKKKNKATQELKKARNKLRTLHEINAQRPDLLNAIKGIGRLVRSVDPKTGKVRHLYGSATNELLAEAVPTTVTMVEMYQRKKLISKPQGITNQRLFNLSVDIMRVEELKTQDLGLLRRRIKQIEKEEDEENAEQSWRQAILHKQFIDEKGKESRLSDRIVHRQQLYDIAKKYLPEARLSMLPERNYFERTVINNWIERGSFPKPQPFDGSKVWTNERIIGKIIAQNFEIQEKGGTQTVEFPYERQIIQRLFKKTRLPLKRKNYVLTQ